LIKAAFWFRAVSALPGAGIVEGNYLSIRSFSDSAAHAA
jgi:hypothetical protein